MNENELKNAIISLKSQAYDIMANIQYLQGQLGKVNGKIAEFSQTLESLPKGNVVQEQVHLNEDNVG